MKTISKKPATLIHLLTLALSLPLSAADQVDKIPVQVDIPYISITNYDDITEVDLNDYFKSFNEPGPTATINLVHQGINEGFESDNRDAYPTTPIEIQLYTMEYDESGSSDSSILDDPYQNYFPSMDAVTYFLYQAKEGNYDDCIIDYSNAGDPYYMRLGFLKVSDDEDSNLVDNSDLELPSNSNYLFSLHNFGFTDSESNIYNLTPLTYINDDNLSHEKGVFAYPLIGGSDTGYYINPYRIDIDLSDNSESISGIDTTFAKVINDDDLSIMEEFIDSDSYDTYTFYTDQWEYTDTYHSSSTWGYLNSDLVGSDIEDYVPFNIPLYGYDSNDNPWQLATRENFCWIYSIELNQDEATPVSSFSLFSYDDDDITSITLEDEIDIGYATVKLSESGILSITPLVLSEEEPDTGWEDLLSYDVPSEHIINLRVRTKINENDDEASAYIHAKAIVVLDHEATDLFGTVTTYQNNVNYFWGITENSSIGLLWSRINGESPLFKKDDDKLHYFYSYNLNSWIWSLNTSISSTSDSYWLWSYRLNTWIWTTYTYWSESLLYRYPNDESDGSWISSDGSELDFDTDS